MHCLTCGYDLQQLEDDRCPECGRGFSKNDPQSYGVPKSYRLLPWAKRSGWLAGLMAAGAGLAAVIGMAVGQYDRVLLIMVWMFALLPVTLACVAYITLLASSGRWPSVRAIVIAVVLLVFNVSLFTQWPTRASFMLHRGALARHAQQTIQQPHLPSPPTQIGVYEILDTSTRTIRGRTVVVLKILDGAGPVYLVSGMTDTDIEKNFNIWSYQRLDDDWHIVHED